MEFLDDLTRSKENNLATKLSLLWKALEKKEGI